jgi:hypothetical protein
MQVYVLLASSCAVAVVGVVVDPLAYWKVRIPRFPDSVGSG